MPKTENDFVPDAVKKQGEAADAAQAAAVAKKAPTKKKVVKKKKPTPAPEVESQETPIIDTVEDTVEATPPADDTWEHKYNTLQGMINRSNHEHSIAIGDLSGKLDQALKLNDTLNNMLQTMNQPGINQTQQPDIAQPLATDEPSIKVLEANDFQGYGPEMVEMVDIINRLAHAVATLQKQKPVSSSTGEDVKARLERIEETQSRSIQDQFYDAIDAALGDWGTQNKDAGFNAWLEEIEPMANVTRRVLLEHAFKTWNSGQVIAIFQSYRDLIDPNSEDTYVDPLEGQVMPETTGNAGDGPGGKPPVKFATLEQFTQAQKDFIAKKVTEEDFNKIANSYQNGIAAQTR